MIRELEHALDLLASRQKAVAGNLANLNTPGYTRNDLDFFGTMKAVFGGGEPVVVPTPDLDSPERLDGNNVNLERELFALTQSDMLFSTVSRLSSDQLKMLNYVVTDGRG